MSVLRAWNDFLPTVSTGRLVWVNGGERLHEDKAH
jgi:hypothetical protein